jgi:hypothetical protein
LPSENIVTALSSATTTHEYPVPSFLFQRIRNSNGFANGCESELAIPSKFAPRQRGQSSFSVEANRSEENKISVVRRKISRIMGDLYGTNGIFSKPNFDLYA